MNKLILGHIRKAFLFPLQFISFIVCYKRNIIFEHSKYNKNPFSKILKYKQHLVLLNTLQCNFLQPNIRSKTIWTPLFLSLFAAALTTSTFPPD